MTPVGVIFGSKEDEMMKKEGRAFGVLAFRVSMAVVLIVMFGATPVAAENNANSKVIPVQAKHRGLSYAEWSALKWQWLFSLPVEQHPLFDFADCSAGQSGKVWFLGGTFTFAEEEPGVIVGEAERECTIPSGTSLFFPLIDAECSTVEGDGETEAELRECANGLADAIVTESLFLIIDGKPVTNVSSLRVKSPLFVFGPLPAGNVLEEQEGTISPAVSDGYFAMVKPLPVGEHTLEFGGIVDLTQFGFIFIQEIEYTINVVPRGQYYWSE
jgi:hypothetical protein